MNLTYCYAYEMSILEMLLAVCTTVFCNIHPFELSFLFDIFVDNGSKNGLWYGFHILLS